MKNFFKRATYLIKFRKLYKITESVNPKFQSLEQIYEKIILCLTLVSQLKPDHPLMQRYVGEISVLLGKKLSPDSLVQSLKELKERYPSYRVPNFKYDEVMIPITVAVLVSHYSTYRLDRQIIDRMNQAKKNMNRPLNDEENFKIFEECFLINKEHSWASYTDEEKLMIINSEKFQ